jgi:putative ABC transport system substrate-binding protein
LTVAAFFAFADDFGRWLEHVPIVFLHVNDPVARGFAASLARPGGNATGFTHLEYQTSAKWLALLKQMVPQLTRVAAVGNFSVFDGRAQWESIRSAAPSLGVELVPLEVSNAGDIERSIGQFAVGSNGGLIITENVATLLNHELIVSLAASHRLPAIYHRGYFVAEGGLMSYAANDAASYRGAASYVDRILKGAMPAELPVQQPTKWELIINLKTAKALGLAVPPTLLAIADEIIE